VIIGSTLELCEEDGKTKERSRKILFESKGIGRIFSEKRKETDRRKSFPEETEDGKWKRRPFSENRSRKRSFSGKSFPGKWNNRRRKKKIVLGRVEENSSREKKRRDNRRRKKRRPFSENCSREKKRRDNQRRKKKIVLGIIFGETRRRRRSIGGAKSGRIFSEKREEEEEVSVERNRIQEEEGAIAVRRIVPGKDRSRKKSFPGKVEQTQKRKRMIVPGRKDRKTKRRSRKNRLKESDESFRGRTAKKEKKKSFWILRILTTKKKKYRFNQIEYEK